jgi:hypothetical protein
MDDYSSQEIDAAEKLERLRVSLPEHHRAFALERQLLSIFARANAILRSSSGSFCT